MDNMNYEPTMQQPVQQPRTEPVQPPYDQQPRTEPVQPPYDQHPWTQPTYAQPPVTPQPTREAASPKNGKTWKLVVAAVAVVALVVVSCFATAGVLNDRFDKRLETTQEEFRHQLEALEQRVDAQENGVRPGNSGTVQTPAATVPSGDYLTPAQVYQQNLASVVLIQNVVQNGFYSSGGTGSGFVISADGYVVTNYHVVEGGGQLSVVLHDGTEHDAKLIGYDNANDVALLKVEAEGLQAVAVGDSDALIVGDQVAAIGNPLGELTSTMTVGYVSAKERDVNTSGFAINMIQTDAAINSGNSGGPLFDMYGRVVGITSAKYSGSSSSGATIEGIGFAIPINDVLPLLKDLMENGYDTGPYLGVSVQDMDSESASYYNLPMGAYVMEVVRGSCAEKGGMQVKDIIVDVGGHTVGNVTELARALRNFKAGDIVEVKVIRGGREQVLTITLDQKPQQLEQLQPQTTEPQGDDWFSNFPGFGG